MSGMSERCKRISKKGIAAMTKHGRIVKFCSLTTQPAKDEYQRLYNENETTENELMTLNCLYTQKPSEKVFKDNELNPQGDAVVSLMTYQLEQLNIIGETLDDYNRVAQMILGCRVVVDTLRYTVIQCVTTSVLEGYPLQLAMSLNLLQQPEKEMVD